MPVLTVLLIPLVSFGAWRAWRSSPLYSAQVNLELMGVYLPVLAAVFAITVGIFAGPARHSQSSELVLVVLTVLLLLCGFIAVIFRISEGRTAHLPPGVRLYDGHRRKLFPWIRRTGILLLVISSSALLVPPRWVALHLIIGGLTLLLATSVLYPLYLKAHRFDRGMTALMASPWVHWQYTPQQWQSWANIQRSWERAHTRVFRWHRDWSKLIFPIFILAGAIWFLGNNSPAQKALVFAGCVAALLLSAGLLRWVTRNQPEWRYRRMMEAHPEAYFGAEGLYCSGEYSPWFLSGNYLVEAAALHDPSSRLILSFDAFKGDGTARLAKLIPIPEGAEVDLGPLQQHLRDLCPKAAIHLIARAPSWSKECVT